MPTYNVKNLKNGDTLELKMSISEYEQWRKDNPDWDRTGHKRRLVVQYMENLNSLKGSKR